MINIKRTIEFLGYHPDDVSKCGYVIRNCSECGKEQKIRKVDIKPADICKSCSKKGSRNGFFRNTLFSGKNNHNYIDGRTINPICKYPGCIKKINKGTIGSGNGFCKSHSKLGERNGRYIDGRTPFYQLIRGCYQMRQWSEAVRKKDDYTCVECGKTSCELHAHHKKPLVQIISEFLDFYKHFNPSEQKEILLQLTKNWEELWDINNGNSLCEDCHKLEHLTKEHLIDRSNV